MENKVVGMKSEFEADIKITRTVRISVNPNGRGYEVDNVTKYLNDEVMEVTLKAGSPSKLAAKIQAVMATIEEDA